MSENRGTRRERGRKTRAEQIAAARERDQRGDHPHGFAWTILGIEQVPGQIQQVLLAAGEDLMPVERQPVSGRRPARCRQLTSLRRLGWLVCFGEE